MTIYLDVVVFEIIFVAWLMFSAKGKELMYSWSMRLLRWYTGFTRFTTVWIGNNQVQSVSFRDGSRYCIERDADGLILVDYSTGGLASVYDRCRRNLAMSFLR